LVKSYGSIALILGLGALSATWQTGTQVSAYAATSKPIPATTNSTPPAHVARGGRSSGPGNNIGSNAAEVVGARSRNAQTYAKAGNYETDVYTTSINYLDSKGQWQPIDNTLVSAPGHSYQNKANQYTVKIPGSLGSTPIHFGIGDSWVEFSLQDAAASAASVSKDTVTYRNAFPGVTLSYRAQPDALKETLSLSGPNAPSKFTYSLRLGPRLAARQNPNHGIDFIDSNGQTQFQFAPPFMYDSASQPQVSNSVNMALISGATGPSVVITADNSWLSSTARQFPVVIDPTIWANVNYYGGQDCFIQNSNPNTNFCSSAAYAGTSDQVGYDGTAINRTLLEFPIQTGYTHIVPNANILDAELDLTLASSTSGSAVPVTANQITQSWNDNYATWNNRDNSIAWSTPGATFSAMPLDTENIGPATGTYRWVHLTQLIQSWVNGSATNYGFLLKASNEASAGLLSFDNQAFDRSNPTDPALPHLRVQWNNWNGLQPWYSFESHQLNDRMNLSLNVANGNLVIHATDLAIKGTGIGLNMDRYYNSLADNVSGGWHIGNGWNVSVGCDIRLDLDDFDGIAYHGPDGYAVLFPSNGSGGWTAPAGLDVDLVKNGDNTYTLTWHQDQEKFNFQAGGCLQNIIDRNGNTISMSYNGSLQSITDTQGRVTTLTYASPIKSTYISQITDPSGRTAKYVYNTNGDLATYTDANSKNTQYSYNANDQLSQIVDPKGNTINLTYGTTYPYKVTQIGYVNTSCAGGSCNVALTYNSGVGSCTVSGVFGNTVVTDANTHATTYCYDTAGRVIQVIDPLGQRTSASYTSDQALASSTDALSQTTSASYNPNNNLTSVTPPVLGSGHSAATLTASFQTPSSVSGYRYLPSSVTDAQGHCTAYVYDPAGNMTDAYAGQANPCDGQTGGIHANDKYQGDPGVSCGAKTGELCSMTDALGNITSYGYDANGNQISVVPPSPLGQTTIVPDGLSRTSSVTDGKGQNTSYSYDQLDRITQVLFNGASTCTPSTGNCISYVYDDDGNRASMTDNTGTTNYYYDTMNRLTTQSLPDASSNCPGSSPAGISFSYDGVGNLTQYCDSGGAVAYAYDAGNRLVSMAEPSGNCGSTPSLCTTFTYNANGERSQTTFPGAATLNVGYDSNRNISSVVGKDKNGTVLTSFSYAYNIGSTDTQLRQTMTQNDPVASNTYTYAYDALNRLIQAAITAGTGTSYTYAYDSNGNMTRKTAGSSTTSYAFNAANELCWAFSGTSNNSCSSVPTGATAFTFDANGNQTGDSSGGAFTYNPKNQTTAITYGGATVSPLTYSGTGQNQRTGAGSTTFANGPSGVQLSTSSGSSAYYLRDNKGKLIGERVGSNHYYYLTDALGSVEAVISGDGLAIGDRYGYDPYGKPTYQSGTIANPWGYASGYTDSTGLIKFGARYYDPGNARWTQVDPLAATRSSCAYTYAGDDPINATDPSGNFCLWKFVVGVFFLGLALFMIWLAFNYAPYLFEATWFIEAILATFALAFYWLWHGWHDWCWPWERGHF
jgi:RHS repeat-associated protein